VFGSPRHELVSPDRAEVQVTASIKATGSGFDLEIAIESSSATTAAAPATPLVVDATCEPCGAEDAYKRFRLLAETLELRYSTGYAPVSASSESAVDTSRAAGRPGVLPPEAAGSDLLSARGPAAPAQLDEPVTVWHKALPVATLAAGGAALAAGLAHVGLGVCEEGEYAQGCAGSRPLVFGGAGLAFAGVLSIGAGAGQLWNQAGARPSMWQRRVQTWLPVLLGLSLGLSGVDLVRDDGYGDRGPALGYTGLALGAFALVCGGGVILTD
jgi:hypothetical protein